MVIASPSTLATLTNTQTHTLPPLTFNLLAGDHPVPSIDVSLSILHLINIPLNLNSMQSLPHSTHTLNTLHQSH